MKERTDTYGHEEWENVSFADLQAMVAQGRVDAAIQLAITRVKQLDKVIINDLESAVENPGAEISVEKWRKEQIALSEEKGKILAFLEQHYPEFDSDNPDTH